jgi:hypothetical protein
MQQREMLVQKLKLPLCKMSQKTRERQRNNGIRDSSQHNGSRMKAEFLLEATEEDEVATSYCSWILLDRH